MERFVRPGWPAGSCRPVTSNLVALLGWQIALLMTLDAHADAVTLVETGQSRAVIVLAADAFDYQATAARGRRKREAPGPAADERLAGEELQEHIRRVSGTTLEFVRQGTPLENRLPIYIGSAADAALDADIRKQGSDPGSFALFVGQDRLSIRGLSSAGTLNGVYELLEQLGVRWFMPGELGMVIPQLQTVRVDQQTTIQTPAFPARNLQGVRAPEWERRMRLGGPYFPASHGAPGFGGRGSEGLFQDHPEYFSRIDGQRKQRQLCISNYKGLAWYRQSIEIPKAEHDKRIFLWVGGVDELAKVWVNGQVIGISPKGSFVPFELDATAAVRPGETNTVVICVGNMTLNEVGTGGITGPVMFYAPAAGKDAEIRNAKPSHPVFPEY